MADKDQHLIIRIDEETKEHITKLSHKLLKSKSELIRGWIDKNYSDIFGEEALTGKQEVKIIHNKIGKEIYLVVFSPKSGKNYTSYDLEKGGLNAKRIISSLKKKFSDAKFQEIK